MSGRLSRYTTIVRTFTETGSTLRVVSVTVLATSRGAAIERATALGAPATARDVTVDITAIDDLLGGAA